MAACDVTPISAFMSTNLNNKINCFEQVAERIKRELGWPLVSLEIHQDGLYQNIQIAVEMFTKFAGYTQEFIIFDSRLYETGRGIRLDSLFSVYNNRLSQETRFGDDKSPAQHVGAYISTSPTVYVATSSIPSTFFSSSSALSAIFTSDIEAFEILDCETYTQILTFDAGLSVHFKPSRDKSITSQCSSFDGNQDNSDCAQGAGGRFNNMFDYDAMDYRKVMAVVDFEEGSNSGINTLFTLEQTLAQQTYFSYSMGNYGFDLVSWYTLKEWLDTRQKMLATKRTYSFDDRTQYLVMYPQPNSQNQEFYGVVSCYVERPIRDVIKELWVQKYALALTKIVIGRVRGKFQGVSLLGGGSFNYDLLEEGRNEKEKLELELKEGASPGWDSEPCVFLVA
jgi:hypothetical protein